ncbi:hypothetical protein [Microvirga sp. VF16]|uniref:hypothetical protein n=1 Tax=Microvirga sp. VF16 TaxID=2807101 RepID=UPI00193EBC57|nr:hypothetical protein [Microvirga sp. VF16]QRM33011.1 hypothetical protein JO965_27170 [Microvirga sp. VF16]
MLDEGRTDSMWNAIRVPDGADGDGSVPMIALNTAGTVVTVEHPDLSHPGTRCKQMQGGAHGGRLGYGHAASG